MFCIHSLIMDLKYLGHYLELFENPFGFCLAAIVVNGISFVVLECSKTFYSLCNFHIQCSQAVCGISFGGHCLRLILSCLSESECIEIYRLKRSKCGTTDITFDLLGFRESCLSQKDEYWYEIWTLKEKECYLFSSEIFWLIWKIRLSMTGDCRSISPWHDVLCSIAISVLPSSVYCDIEAFIAEYCRSVGYM